MADLMGMDASRDTPALLDGARLAALRDTQVLDVAPDGGLERLNRMAMRLLGVPVSLISLVGHDRQFFAAQSGLPEPWASSRETPLSHSFCQWVVERDDMFVVEDARSHPLVADNLAVRDLDVVAYAGMPVRLSTGETLGAFCAIDDRPRTWTAEELDVLRDLAALAADALELRAARSGGLHDSLTGLPSRALFTELVGAALESPGDTAVHALDIDRFRLLNDAFGHAVGDAVLVSVGRRLVAAVRPGDVVCRMAGDQFLVLSKGVTAVQSDAVLARLLAAVADEPVHVGGRSQAVAVTGATAVSSGSTSHAAESLMDDALLAVARARQGASAPSTGSGRRTAATSRLLIADALVGAHERGEMHVVYQPIVDLETGRMREVEALVRWRHPELGVVAPDRFIPDAETSGAIVALGEWILGRACEDVARWRAMPGGELLAVAVNVAAPQLNTANFSDRVAAALAVSGLPSDALTVELTERTLLDERASLRHTVGTLRDLGVGLALDDFGTGYSALSYLTRFPIDRLKIDRSFVRDLAQEHQAAALVRGVVALAAGLGMHTVAEGVETFDQLRALTGLNCDAVQGYLLARPVDAATITELLGGDLIARAMLAGRP